MFKMIIFAFVFYVSWCPVHSKTTDFFVSTAYGDFIVTEPILIDLFKSPTMERLKGIHQYGVSDYIIGDSNYSRYEHSVGVWALLRHYGASLEEQIAGLLHDASHTVFSHVSDFLFKEYSPQNSYQDDIHDWSLKEQGIDKIIEPYGLTLKDINPKNHCFRRLEQDLPDLCADRIEYNFKAGVLIGYLKEEEIKTIMNDLSFDTTKQEWFFKTEKIAHSFANISLYNSLHVWGGPENFVINTLFASILKYAVENGVIHLNEIHFSTDDIVWEKLSSSKDAYIKKSLFRLKEYKKTFETTSCIDPKHSVVVTKFRGLDPLVNVNDVLVRLTDIDSVFRTNYNETKDLTTKGWVIRLIHMDE